MTQEELGIQVRKLISENKTREAIDLLLDKCPDIEKQNELSITKGRYIRLEEDKRNNIRPRDEIEQEHQAINSSILNFVEYQPCLPYQKDIEEKETYKKRKLSDFRTDLEISIVRVRVAELLLEAYDNGQLLSMGEIVKKTDRTRKHIVDFICKELKSFGFIEKNKIDEIMRWKLTEEGKSYLSGWMGN